MKRIFFNFFLGGGVGAQNSMIFFYTVQYMNHFLIEMKAFETQKKFLFKWKKSKRCIS